MKYIAPEIFVYEFAVEAGIAMTATEITSQSFDFADYEVVEM